MSKETKGFAVSVKWTEGGRGRMSRPGKADVVVSSPSELGGEGAGLTPEEMVVGAVVVCHMLTFLYFVKTWGGITLKGYEADGSGTVQKGPQGLYFSGIEMRAKAGVTAGERDKTMTALEKAHKYCLVSNSLKCPVETSFEVEEE